MINFLLSYDERSTKFCITLNSKNSFAKIIDKFILQSMKIEYGKAIPNECA